MTVWTNSLMENLLATINKQESPQPITLPTSLLDLLYSGFREEQSCILFSDSVYFGPGDLITDFEKSSYEAFLNETNINMLSGESYKDLEDLRIGIEFGKRLYYKLKSTYNNQFRVIIRYNLEIDLALWHSDNGECIVRFHIIRPDNDEVFRKEEIDLEPEEAIMILE